MLRITLLIHCAKSLRHGNVYILFMNTCTIRKQLHNINSPKNLSFTCISQNQLSVTMFIIVFMPPRRTYLPSILTP